MSDPVRRYSANEKEGEFSIDLEALKPSYYHGFVMASVVNEVVKALKIKYEESITISHGCWYEVDSQYSTLIIRPYERPPDSAKFKTELADAAQTRLEEALRISTGMRHAG